MSELKSVQLAIDLATRQRDESGKLLVKVQRTWQVAMNQLEQLQSYAADTESKWAVSGQAGVTPETVRHYYQFMDRLRQAMTLQDLAMANLNRDLVSARTELMAAEVRIVSLKQLLTRKKSRIDQVEAGREQKQMDEFAATQHRRLRNLSDAREMS